MSIKPELLRLRDSIKVLEETTLDIFEMLESLNKNHKLLNKELNNIINNIKE